MLTRPEEGLERPLKNKQEQVTSLPWKSAGPQTLKILCLLVGGSLKTGELFYYLNGSTHSLPKRGRLSSVNPSLTPVLPNTESGTLGKMREKVKNL